MKFKAWGIFLCLTLVLATMASARPSDTRPPFMDARQGERLPAKVITPDTPYMGQDALNPWASDFRGSNLNLPRRDEPMGDVFTIGSTWYDYQHNGSIGKMLAKDSEGDMHFTWMKGYDAQQATRHVVYNFMDDGVLLYEPDDSPVVDNGTRSGYTCLTLLPADQRAIIFYHVVAPPGHANDYTGTAMGVDFDRGFAAFSSSYPNPWANTTLIWPHGALSRNNLAHILSTENGPDGQTWQRVAYWRGESDRAFENWGWNEVPVNVDTAGTISAVASASVTSNKVVLAWFHNRVGADRGPWADVGGWWQKNNDIHYIVSNDGRNFNWRDSVKSLTKIIAPRPELAEFDMQEAYGDTFRPYCDIDIQFDPWGEDQLYAVFPTAGFWEEPVEDDDPEPADGATAEHCILWFWNGELDTITMVANGYYFNRTDNGGNWHSRCGAWRMNADRGSIAFNPDEAGMIYVVWVSFPKIQELNPDYEADPQNEPPFLYDFPAQDTSGAGYKAAEVMVSISDDYGITWREPINVTDTWWDGEEAPEPGQMASEAWASVAYLADDTLHIGYVRDTEAGGTIQTPSEGPATNSPFVYQRIPIDVLELGNPVELPVRGFTFHNNLDFRPQIDLNLARRNPGAPTPANQVSVTANVVGGGEHELTGVWLVYQINGDPNSEREVQMNRINGDVWGASIPSQQAGTTVWYRVRAVNDANLPTIAPNNYWWGYIVREEGNLTIADVQTVPDGWGTDYSFYNGYEVMVTGVVTTPPTFNAEYGAIAIQDGAVYWSGIFCRNVEQDLAVGTRVRVTGIVHERDSEDPTKWEYETYIDADNVEVLGNTAPPNPIRINSLDELSFSGGVEGLEGVLVNVRNVVIDSLEFERGLRMYWPIVSGDYNAWFSILGLTDADINRMGIPTFTRGTEIDQMIGVISENYGHYAVQLRTPADLSGVSVEETSAPSPYGFELSPAFPNPFNAITSISFSLPSAGFATVAIFDLSGREVARVAEGAFQAGVHNFTVDASELATGIYMMKLEAGDMTASQKIVLVK
jgi:hypothetical protein